MFGSVSLSLIYLNNNGMSGSFRYSLRDSMALANLI